LRKQLGLGSASDGAADTWNAIAGAAGASGPISHLQKLQRRLSQYTTQKTAYSEAHGGMMLVLYVDSRWAFRTICEWQAIHAVSWCAACCSCVWCTRLDVCIKSNLPLQTMALCPHENKKQ
jgi:hypothetical protein